MRMYRQAKGDKLVVARNKKEAEHEMRANGYSAADLRHVPDDTDIEVTSDGEDRITRKVGDLIAGPEREAYIYPEWN